MKLSSLLRKTVTVGENDWEVADVTLRRISPEPTIVMPPADTRCYCMIALSYSTLRPMFMKNNFDVDCRPDVTAHYQEAWLGTKEDAEMVAILNPDYAPCVFPTAWAELITQREPQLAAKYFPRNDPRRGGC